MEIFIPDYYPSFRCLAADCPDSCCKEWTVDIDPASAKYYRSLPGDLGDRLRRALKDTGDSTIMEIENGRCPMWRQDGLCRIQAELGHDALSQTCRDYPRLRHDFGDFVELGLELSCPEAARLILTSQGHKLFVQAQPGGTEPEYDTECMEILRTSRKEVLDFLDTSSFSIPETLAIILLYSHSVQSAIDGGEFVPLMPDLCLQDAKKFAKPGDLPALRKLFLGLEILTDRWRTLLLSANRHLLWHEPLQALLRYLIQRYWLQAISDYDLVCRVKFMIASCILICSLDGDITQSAPLYSKEIENDIDNVEALFDSAYTSPALTDTNLLGLLLNS